MTGNVTPARCRPFDNDEIRALRSFVFVHTTTGHILYRVTTHLLEKGTAWTLSGALTLAPGTRSLGSAYIAFKLNMGFDTKGAPIQVTGPNLPDAKILVKLSQWNHPALLTRGVFWNDHILIDLIVNRVFSEALRDNACQAASAGAS